MELLFIIISVVLVVSCLLYVYLRSRRRVTQFANQLTTAQAMLKQSHEIERQLREDIGTIQNKFNHTLEDSVTKLLGWQLFEDRLNQNIKESERYQMVLGVLFIDINNFKVINDAISYEVGDALLQEVAKRLQPCVRQVDSLSRFTKDTFVALLAQLGKPEAAAVVAQRMLQTLARPFHIKEHELYITACIGIAIYPTDGQDAAALLRSADHALHLAKEKGKHLYQFYQEKMHTKSQRELTLYTSLNRESLFDEFVLYYQPIVNARTESIMCMDALLHWQHPELGLISPHDLYYYAEKQRKLNLISEWLLHNACRQFQYWRSLGFAPELLGIPVTLKQLENTHFIYRISQILQELEFKPEWLLLEIQEDSASSSLAPETLEKTFNMLKFMGVKIAIDDFGTGFFSLSNLKNFTIHYLKLHSSLIEDVDKNQQTVSLVKSLVFLVQNLSIQLIIQGVDSDQQVAVLKTLGCFLLQGQLLGAPLSEREVAHKMTESSP